MARIVIAFTIVASTILCFSVPTASADAGADFDVAAGHFYSQTNGNPKGAAGGGFIISDAAGIPFWSFFQQAGGVTTLGYPISRRFIWDGYVCQATQRGILQWNAASRTVQLANVFDYLSQSGKDSWLAAAHIAPQVRQTAEEASGLPLPFILLAHYRFHWIYSDPAIFHQYFTTPNYYAVYGLPTSPVEDLGAYYAERFQRVVIYHWKTSMPWTDSYNVSVGLSGDLFRELGGIPSGALNPKPATASMAALPVITSKPSISTFVRPVQHTVELPASGRPASGPVRFEPRTDLIPDSVTGVATWYGAEFEGSPMADGEIYDMYDPHFAASNMYPLGTYLWVTRLTTGKSITVRVTDRGAFRYPNVLDLSYAAFSQLADPASGVIGVRVEPVRSADQSGS